VASTALSGRGLLVSQWSGHRPFSPTPDPMLGKDSTLRSCASTRSIRMAKIPPAHTKGCRETAQVHPDEALHAVSLSFAFKR
jgi:hypothetical protein